MHVALARLALALAYPPLAHWATHAGTGSAAAIALADLALVVLIDPMLRGRAWALATFAGLLAALYALAGSGHTQTLLLAPPVLFLALLSWFFGRSLRAPRVPLITRIACALENHGDGMPADLAAYTRRLTAAWSVVLGSLAVINALLAFAAVPGGVADRLHLLPPGPPPVWAVPREHWSLIANLLNYGIVGLFFAGEYALRQRQFRQHRPYRNFGEFVGRMARLGPDFWRGLFR